MTQPTSVYEHSSEIPALIDFSPDEIANLLTESRDAFVATQNDPNATIYDLLKHFQIDYSFSIVGYKLDDLPASYIFTCTDSQQGVMTLGPMYVGEVHRGKGLGRQQVEDFVQLARSNGLRAIYTRTWANNEASRHIFDALGFLIENVTLGDRVDGDNTLHYRLEL